MALTEMVSPPPAPGGEDAPGRSRRRAVFMTAYALAFGVWWATVGLPTDYAVAFCWLWLATVAWNHDRPWRRHLEFARDWVPVLLLLVLYDLSRGFADELLPVHIHPMIDADRAMFGVVPTVWLQQHLYTPGQVHWWDVGASFVYFSHFVVSLTVAVVLWLRNRTVWLQFMRRWFLLTFAGLVTYFLYPAAPPWFASQVGAIPDPVYRTSSVGWQEIGLHSAGKVISAGQAMSNQVAAMPSLHSAFAMLVVAFFFTRVSRRWLPVLLLYPLAMTFTLVYAGEHYVADVLVGWTYVVLTFLVMRPLERRWEVRRAARTAAAEAVPVGARGEPVADGDISLLR